MKIEELKKKHTEELDDKLFYKKKVKKLNLNKSIITETTHWSN